MTEPAKRQNLLCQLGGHKWERDASFPGCDRFEREFACKRCRRFWRYEGPTEAIETSRQIVAFEEKL